MAYFFAGFFVSPKTASPDELHPDAVWREIDAPFVGIGLRLPEFIGESPKPEKILALAEKFGFNKAERWIYLTYDTWGGEIDGVYGLVWQQGDLFGPIDSSNTENVEEVYTTLMAHFGLTAKQALLFEPFSRGFWGEN